MSGLQGVTAGRIGLLVEQALRARVQEHSSPGAAGPASSAVQKSQPASLPVSKPLGESGASISSLDISNSFLSMFIMEASHLPAQVRRAGGGHHPQSQDVSLTVTVLPDGTPVAVGGSAETRWRDENGVWQTVRELAYVSGLRRLTTSSAGTLLGGGIQAMPPVERNADSPLDARRVLEDRRTLLAAVPSPLAGLLRAVAPETLAAMAGELGRVAGALGRLSTVFGTLAKQETFAAVEAGSSAPLHLMVEAGPGAVPGTHRVEVVQTARGHSVRSDQMPDGALGLSGSFRINGATVEVTAADTLVDLATKIAKGEDVNGNGQLDAGEDTNGNYQLDGGTARHGTQAGFYESRLLLTRVDSQAGEISLDDPDGILRAVGLLKLDERGTPVFKNELARPQEAAIVVDGRGFRSADNVFSDVIPGVALTLVGDPGEPVTVTVERSTEPAAAALGAALEEFNAALRTANAALGSAGGLLSRDPAMIRTRQELLRALVDPVAGRPADLNEAADAGVEPAGRARAVFSAAQLASAARNERAGLGGLNSLRPAEDPPSVYNALDELGITAGDDNTFALDREKFARVLAEHPAEVADLFARAEEGIAARVLTRVEAAAGSSGLLLIRQAALTELADAGLGKGLAAVLAPDPRRALLESFPKAG
jgi:flagellar capping protein FliD